RVQRLGDPVDREVVVAGGEPKDGEDAPQRQRDQGDRADALADPVGDPVLGRAQAAGARKRRAVADHVQSAPVMASISQMARVAAAGKAKTKMALALADFRS